MSPINIGKDLAEKQPELKDLSEDERVKTFRQLGVSYEMEKLRKDLADFNINYDSWFSETSLYEQNEITEVLKRNSITCTFTHFYFLAILH